jgi:hypothetical protein
VQPTYPGAHVFVRVRKNPALGITGQGLGSADACRVPWANVTTTATTQS